MGASVFFLIIFVFVSLSLLACFLKHFIFHDDPYLNLTLLKIIRRFLSKADFSLDSIRLKSQVWNSLPELQNSRLY